MYHADNSVHVALLDVNTSFSAILPADDFSVCDILSGDDHIVHETLSDDTHIAQ